MLNTNDHYERWRELEVEKLLSTGLTDVNTIRELLIFSCHSSPLSKQYFESRMNDNELLDILIGLALDDYSGDAKMTASFWISRFSSEMLAPYKSELAEIAANEWDRD